MKDIKEENIWDLVWKKGILEELDRLGEIGILNEIESLK